MKLNEAMCKLSMAKSFAEVRGLCADERIFVNNVIEINPEVEVKNGDVIQRGKHLIRKLEIHEPRS